jgi:hypothetical protein
VDAFDFCKSTLTIALLRMDPTTGQREILASGPEGVAPVHWPIHPKVVEQGKAP